MGWGFLREGRNHNGVVVVVAKGVFGGRFAASAEQDRLPWPQKASQAFSRTPDEEDL
jgi:hypothetical protein